MNHVGILEEKYWPKGIFVNWWVTGKGSKISKSKGGAEPIHQLIKKFSVDALRLYYCHVGSPHADIVWNEETAQKYKNGLERICLLFEEKLGNKKTPTDDWLVNVVDKKINETTKYLENYDLRNFANTTYFSIIEDFKWYIRRLGDNKKVFQECLRNWCKILAPITPHLAEELWEVIGGKNFVSTEKWPEIKEIETDLKSIAREELVRNTIDGLNKVLKLAKIENPKKAKLYVSEDWKYNLFEKLGKELAVTRNVREIMKKIMSEESIKKQPSAGKLLQTLIKNPKKIPPTISDKKTELDNLKSAKEFFEKEFNILFEISEKSNEKANPGRPAIVLE